MENTDGGTGFPLPRKKIFLRFFIFNCLISIFMVTIFGFSIIPAQEKKIIAGLKNYSRLIYSGLYPVVSSSVVLEDYGESIENSLKVIEDNPMVRYVVFGRKDGMSIVNLRKKWYQAVDSTMPRLSRRNHQFIRSGLVREEVFNAAFPVNYAGIDWGHIYIGLSTDEYHRELRTLYSRTFMTAFLSVLVSLLASFFLAKRLTRPIKQLAETTSRIGAGDLTARSEIRTGDEIEVLSRAIDQMVEALSNSRDEVKRKHATLLDIAHRAGMAEVAIDVLHNVGNVLNSVHVISSSITGRLKESRIFNISRFAGDMEANRHRLSDYVGEEGRAEKMIRFLTGLARHLEDENLTISKDMEAMNCHVSYIMDIVKCQQLYSKPAGFMEPVCIDELILMAIQISGNALEKHGIRLVFKATKLPDMVLNRHKIIQILNNLINNAIDAVLTVIECERSIGVSAGLSQEGSLVVCVKDNGNGIPEENLVRIFHHGFTTKKGGHGFGLHSCALFAQEMKGSLNVYSSGLNQGALFELVLPVETKAGQP
jgi:signal transduction histidine kinase